jgi:hypothetical protein
MWGLLREHNLLREVEILESFCVKKVFVWMGEPIGLPRVVIPAESDLEMSGWISRGKPPGEYRIDFFVLMCKPKEGPTVLIISITLEMRAWGAPKEPSSKYHVCNAKPGTSWDIRRIKHCKAIENRKGPRGSPCCEPVEDSKVWPVGLPSAGRNRWEGVE